jgi:hypothetical protein
MGAVLAGASLLAISVPPAAAGASPQPGAVLERPIASQAPDAGLVDESFVRVYDPLPASAPPHPTACDWITYLRFRSADGSSQAKDADAVIVAMPGFLGGASDFDQVARNTVRDAAGGGKDVEFWALDRRSNCLEDNTGLRAAARLEDPAVAYRYYWGHAQANGRRFGGFASHSDASVVTGFGLERTVRDWYTVLRTGTPSQRWRSRHVVCGGHSLGGPLTAAFAGWDFDGDPSTQRDAGYNQCAGLLGFDTSLVVGSSGGGGPSIDPVGLLFDVASATGAPYIDIPALNPETFQVPGVLGVGAFYHPQATELLRDLPETLNVNLAQRVLFSRDAANFATGIPSVRDFTLTNEAALGGVFDDNSAPLFFLRSSLGSLTGGPAVDKNFPVPDQTAALPGDPSTPLYSWERYSQVDTPAKCPTSPSSRGRCSRRRPISSSSTSRRRSSRTSLPPARAIAAEPSATCATTGSRSCPRS